MARYANNDEVVHGWAHRSSESGSNPGGTIYFRDNTIFSYGDHFPMAKFVNFNDVLLTYATYSSTTSSHQSLVWRAVSHKNTVYVMDVADPLGERSVKDTIAKAKGHLEDAAKRRSADRAGQDVHSAWQCVENLYEVAGWDDYKKAWKALPGKSKRELGAMRKLIASAKIDAKAALAKLSAASKKALERERKAKAAQLQKNKDRAKEDMRDFLAGDNVPYGRLHLMRQLMGTDALRLESEGHEVRTSQNLVVPAADCWKAWPFIRRAYREGTAVNLSEAGERFRFGHFRMDAIEKDGTVVVGCHRFSKAIVENLAAQLSKFYGDAQQQES